ncbi:MAG: hypothetical protein GXP63_03015 [DPANN group archaeon]|nr:hypothetical protein [DPANN group archaeon]
MRFKRLRISVGIALIVFFFVVGNIIVSGTLAKDDRLVRELPAQNVAAITDPKELPAQKIVIMSNAALPEENAEMKETTKNAKVARPAKKAVQTSVVEPASPPPPQTIIHHRRRTRAS